MSSSLIGVLLVLVAGIQFCVSALESALFALREHRIPTIAGGDLELSRRLRALLDSKQSRLGQALVLSALCNTGLAALGLVLVRRIQPDLDLSPIALGGLLFGTIILLCHLLPNLVASLRPHWVFTAIAPGIILLATAVKPFERGLQATAGWITDLLVPASLQPNQSLQDEELETLVEMRRDEGAFEDLEGEVIHEILKLGDKTAKDCMTPRVDAVTIPIDLPADEASRRLREQDHRQIPVYDGTPDEIVGVLDVIAYLRSADDDFRPHLRPPTFVPETLGAIELFQRHLSSARGIVVVLDEFGGFEGIVSRTDVIEHLVGDVAPSEEVEIQSLGRGRFLVSGSARLDELREVTGIDLETAGIDTIGGLLATNLGRIPAPGESVALDPLAVTIRKSSSKRIEELLLVVPNSDLEGGGGLMSVAALCICLALSFLLSGLESAIFSVNVVRVRHRAKVSGGWHTKEERLERVLSRRSLLLTAVLLSNNALALVAFFIATGLLVDQYSDSGYWIAFIISLPVYIFVCELVPKSLFSRFPYRMLRFFVIVLEIINLTVGQLLRLVLLIKPDFQEESQRLEGEIDDRARARSEFRSLARIIAREGTMAPAEKEMIENVMSFRRTRIGDLMVPLAKVTAIPLDMPAHQIIKLSRETGLEEFPVMSKTGDLIGIVSAVEIMRERPESASAVNFLRRLLKVGLEEPASNLVPRLRKSGLRVAAVCTDDASKTTLGIVSLEDIFQRMLQKS